jgi:hypothetical protein
MGLTITIVLGMVILIKWRGNVIHKEREKIKDRERRIKP